MREVIYQGYLIIYQITPNLDIEIITIAHGREDLFNDVNKDWIL
ncbi:MAG: type II toxin-antitoxin system RelE/ParE family toxin [Cyclobacteriaceae bacterium]|nr:type II toxin-antitoxin system RelE/ParE family toxin [Cyclobacteriaceae bacterium]